MREIFLMSSEPVIKLSNISKKYKLNRKSSNNLREHIKAFFLSKKKPSLGNDEFWALKDININVNKGESVGIYGPNGSGKTTLIKLISNVTIPTEGEIIVNGSIAPLVSVGAGFHPELTGRENIYTNGTILGMSIKYLKSVEEDIINFSGLDKEFINMPVKKYSSGMNARLGFSVAVHCNADIYLLDEVISVGDEEFKKKCSEKVMSLIESNKTILIVTHNLELLKSITNRIIYMRKGKIVDNK